jgi:signal transduction histidine kinase
MKKSVKSINLCESVIQTSYDIVKEHDGEIKVESKDGEGTSFMVIIPNN